MFPHMSTIMRNGSPNQVAMLTITSISTAMAGSSE